MFMLILKMSLILILAKKLDEICEKASKEGESLALTLAKKNQNFQGLLKYNLTDNIASVKSHIQNQGLIIKQ